MRWGLARSSRGRPQICAILVRIGPATGAESAAPPQTAGLKIRQNQAAVPNKARRGLARLIQLFGHSMIQGNSLPRVRIQVRGSLNPRYRHAIKQLEHLREVLWQEDDARIPGSH
jgi:hypothetical protein